LLPAKITDIQLAYPSGIFFIGMGSRPIGFLAGLRGLQEIISLTLEVGFLFESRFEKISHRASRSEFLEVPLHHAPFFDQKVLSEDGFAFRLLAP
jgi:hypothetical protein